MKENRLWVRKLGQYERRLKEIIIRFRPLIPVWLLDDCWVDVDNGNDLFWVCKFFDHMSNTWLDFNHNLCGRSSCGCLAGGSDRRSSDTAVEAWMAKEGRWGLGIVAHVVWLEITWISHSPFFTFFLMRFLGWATLPVVSASDEAVYSIRSV